MKYQRNLLFYSQLDANELLNRLINKQEDMEFQNSIIYFQLKYIKQYTSYCLLISKVY